MKVIGSAMAHRPDLEIRAFIDVPRMAQQPPDAREIGHSLLVQRLQELESLHPQLKVQVRNQNLGTEGNLTEALDSAFEEFDYCVVLEDDCIPSKSFFDFMDFAKDFSCSNAETIGLATGSNHYFYPLNSSPHLAYLSGLSHVWGWSMTAKNWESLREFILNPPLEPQLLALHERAKSRLVYLPYKRHWEGILSLEWSKMSWDYKLQFWLWYNDKFCIVPGRNLVENVGFDAVATNSEPIPDHYQNRSGRWFKAMQISKLQPSFLTLWELTGYRLFALSRLIRIAFVNVRN